MTDYKNLLLLASEMLDLAHDDFSNHGCNDLDEKVYKLITDDMLKEMRFWNSRGKDPWPEEAKFVGDSSLMAYLSYKLKDIAVEMDRDIKIDNIINNEGSN